MSDRIARDIHSDIHMSRHRNIRRKCVRFGTNHIQGIPDARSLLRLLQGNFPNSGKMKLYDLKDHEKRLVAVRFADEIDEGSVPQPQGLVRTSRDHQQGEPVRRQRPVVQQVRLRIMNHANHRCELRKEDGYQSTIAVVRRSKEAPAHRRNL